MRQDGQRAIFWPPPLLLGVSTSSGPAGERRHPVGLDQRVQREGRPGLALAPAAVAAVDEQRRAVHPVADAAAVAAAVEAVVHAAPPLPAAAVSTKLGNLAMGGGPDDRRAEGRPGDDGRRGGLGAVGVYYKALGAAGVPPLEVLSHRTLWSVLFFAIVLAVQGRGVEVSEYAAAAAGLGGPRGQRP